MGRVNCPLAVSDVMNDSSLSEHPPDLAGPSVDRLAALEQRVVVLEECVALLRDTRQLEERITERVATRLPPPPEPSAPLSDSLMPASGMERAVQSSWLLLDLVREVRSVIAMFFDGRYHMAWVSRVTAIVLVIALLTSSWWFPLSLLPVVGSYADKLLDLCLSLLLFLVLNRETRRYRDWRACRR